MQGDYGIDITSLFELLTIEEDIEGGFVKGQLSFIDDFSSDDVYNGTEMVEISFSSFDHDKQVVPIPYDKKFRVIGFKSAKDRLNGLYDVIVIDFSSDASVKNDSIKLARTYNKVSSSQFVNNCCDILGVEIPRHIEETLHSRDFVAPNVSPLDMINWVKLTSQSKENSGSDFYFFENKDGINFKSIETIKSTEPTQTIYYKPQNELFTFNAILNMEKPKGYDLRDDIRYGGAGATVYTHDMITKQYKKFTYDSSKISKLNPVDPRGNTYEKNNDSYVQFWSHNTSYSTMDLNSNTHNALLRSLSRTLINFKTLNVTIAGNIEIKSGDVIEVKIPASTGKLRREESGKWLVKKLKHILQPSGFVTHLELSTDGNIE
jgi:hypothetical protein